MGAPDEGALDVVVVSPELLVRDVVTTALNGLGFATTSRPLPTTVGQFEEAHRWLAQAPLAVGVLVVDLDQPTQVHAAVAVVRGLELPWLLLTSAAPGAVWGALIEAGVREVMESSTQLVEMSRMIHRIARAEEPSAPHRAAVVRAWKEVNAQRRGVTERLERLSAREMQVVSALNEGLSVSLIAARDGVAVGTVRAQVRSILRKLEVRSQLRAVAAYREEREWFGW